jgi:ATP-binding cassette subfamily B protein
MRKALFLSLKEFEQPDILDKLTRSRRGAASRAASLVQQEISIAGSAITLACYVAIIVHFNLIIAVALSIALIPAFASELWYSHIAFQQQTATLPDTKWMSYLEYVSASNEHAKEVRIFDLGETLLKRYKALVTLIANKTKSLLISRTKWTFAASLVGSVAFYSCYAFIAVRAAAGSISVGDMVLYLFSLRQIQIISEGILMGIREIYEHSLYMIDLFAVLELSPSKDIPKLTVGERSTSSENGIRFERVSFKYQGSEKWILKDISLFVPQGTSLAIVGENGEGKSTLVKLMLGLYQPGEGRILIDGVDVRDISEQILRGRFGVLFQDYNRFQMSVRDNVIFGDVHSIPDDSRVEEALSASDASDFVSSFESRLDTQIGTHFAGGAELSGGQWQRIALARAFIRRSADFVVLDEPTSALDPIAERRLLDRFHAATRGKTAILVSHRFPSVRRADRIVVLRNNSIAEDGSHEELILKNGIYAKMFRLQAEGYL